ncbi:hypothetical protein N1851_013577 [Merluccius polli]|uniref:Uncharacterized protein n=1 Tax=Merluccius polli TaxID=89951 RepID=A0AA47MUR6_MERPO|nr:hypothetical protein N1851_013577 [Merluccius polli]
MSSFLVSQTYRCKTNVFAGLHRSPAATAGSAVPRKTSSSSHVAFGSTVSGPPPPPQHARKSSRSQEQMHARGSDLSLRASESKAARDRSARSPDATPRSGESAFQADWAAYSPTPHKTEHLADKSCGIQVPDGRDHCHQCALLRCMHYGSLDSLILDQQALGPVAAAARVEPEGGRGEAGQAAPANL